jgi:uncharacterized protein (TIGR02265 family)
MPEPMVFDETIENLLRPYRKRITPALTRKLLELGMYLSGKLKPQYPRASHDLLLKALCDEFYPRLPMEQSSYKIGEDSIKVLEEGLMGKTLMRMLRLLPHTAALKRLPTIFRIGNNYLDVKVNVTGKWTYDLEFNEIGAYPHYWLGLMTTSNRMMFGYVNSTMVLNKYDGHAASISVNLKPGETQ